MSLVLERPHPAFPTSGVQMIHRFDNGYGASVVRFKVPSYDYSPESMIVNMVSPGGSYGADEGLWELGVVKFTGPEVDDFELDYTTHITDDVLGYLTDEDVENTLAQIAALPKED